MIWEIKTFVLNRLIISRCGGLEKQPRLDLQLSESLASLGIMGDLWSAPWNSRTSQHSIILRGLSGTLNWVLLIPRDASLSYSQCEISQSGYCGGLQRPRLSPTTPHRGELFGVLVSTCIKCMPTLTVIGKSIDAKTDIIYWNGRSCKLYRDPPSASRYHWNL